MNYWQSRGIPGSSLEPEGGRERKGKKGKEEKKKRKKRKGKKRVKSAPIIPCFERGQTPICFGLEGLKITVSITVKSIAFPLGCTGTCLYDWSVFYRALGREKGKRIVAAPIRPRSQPSSPFSNRWNLVDPQLDTREMESILRNCTNPDPSRDHGYVQSVNHRNSSSHSYRFGWGFLFLGFSFGDFVKVDPIGMEIALIIIELATSLLHLRAGPC